jgi:hypothetical protein
MAAAGFGVIAVVLGIIGRVTVGGTTDVDEGVEQLEQDAQDLGDDGDGDDG